MTTPIVLLGTILSAIATLGLAAANRFKYFRLRLRSAGFELIVEAKR
jgi:hypothetical protein